MNFTPVEALPAELSSLAKLKYLLLAGTERLAEVPKGTISNLPLLKLLDLFGSKYADMDELEGFKGCRKSIGITLHSMTDLQRLGSLRQLSTWKLQLQNMTELAYPSQLFESIMSSHNTRQGLERLEIVHVLTGGELRVARSNEDHEEGFECLRYMALRSVNDLQEITSKVVKLQTVFPYLHELNISECRMLRNVTWILQLPNLSVLKVSNCDEMEELISCVGSSASSSIGLRVLSLAGLSKLNCISRQSLTFLNLERLYVVLCPKLRKWPFGAKICHNKLKGIFGEMDWWENIEWENVNEENAFLPYFKYIWDCRAAITAAFAGFAAADVGFAAVEDGTDYAAAAASIAATATSFAAIVNAFAAADADALTAATAAAEAAAAAFNADAFALAVNAAESTVADETAVDALVTAIPSILTTIAAMAEVTAANLTAAMAEFTAAIADTEAAIAAADASVVAASADVSVADTSAAASVASAAAPVPANVSVVDTDADTDSLATACFGASSSGCNRI